MRKLTKAEHRELTALSRSRTAPAAHATRAKLLLRVAVGPSFQDAARAAGRQSGAAVPRHGGGRARVDDEQARDRSLREAQRVPPPQQDGTAPWALSTLPKALREAAAGLPHVWTYTRWPVRRAAG